MREEEQEINGCVSGWTDGRMGGKGKLKGTDSRCSQRYLLLCIISFECINKDKETKEAERRERSMRRTSTRC